MKSACRSPAGTSLNDGSASSGPFAVESAPEREGEWG